MQILQITKCSFCWGGFATSVCEMWPKFL